MDEAREIIAPIVLALFGGIAGYAMRGGARNIWQFLSDMIISAFAGILMFFILDNYDLSASWKAVFISLSGCMAREILVLITNRFMKTVKTITTENDRNE